MTYVSFLLFSYILIDILAFDKNLSYNLLFFPFEQSYLGLKLALNFFISSADVFVVRTGSFFNMGICVGADAVGAQWGQTFL